RAQHLVEDGRRGRLAVARTLDQQVVPEHGDGGQGRRRRQVGVGERRVPASEGDQAVAADRQAVVGRIVEPEDKRNRQTDAGGTVVSAHQDLGAGGGDVLERGGDGRRRVGEAVGLAEDGAALGAGDAGLNRDERGVDVLGGGVVGGAVVALGLEGG